jgi:hypothetical protein
MSNVKNFGARGDGIADDTQALQHAVAKATDGRVEFPRGDYRISKTIEVRLAEHGRIGFTGLGGVGRITMTGPGPALRFVGTHTKSADPQTFASQVWEKERMPQVEGLEFVGAHEDADGIEFFRVMQPTLLGVLIREVRHGVRLRDRNRNLLMDSCHVYNCRGVGVFLDRVNLHQAIIHGCHISYCKAGGIRVVAGEIRNLHVTGNDIEYNFDPRAKESADVCVDCSEGGSVREGSIVSNTIQARVSPGGANVRFVGPADVNKVSMWTVSGNHISNQAVNVHLKNCRGIVLTGNSVALSGERNILIEGSRHIVVGAHSLDHNPDYKDETTDGITLRDCDGCILNGVLIEGAKAGTEEKGGAVELFDCRETTVVGCQVLDPKYRGIYAAGCRNTRVADCTVMDRRPDATMRVAIEVAGKSPGTLIRGNLVGEGTTAAIRASGVKVDGNELVAK